MAQALWVFGYYGMQYTAYHSRNYSSCNEDWEWVAKIVQKKMKKVQNLLALR